MAKRSKTQHKFVETILDTSPAKLVHLLVRVPETIAAIPANESFPVLIYVDPSDASLEVSYQDHPPDKSPTKTTVLTQPTMIAGFNYIAWIPLVNLTPSVSYTMHVYATKATYDSNHHCCRIFNPATSALDSTATPPTIAYPSAGAQVPTSFTACGYDNPPTTQVTGWVAVATGSGVITTYPGTTLGSPPAPYNWAVSFSGLPGKPVPGQAATLTIQIPATGAQTTESINIIS